MKVKGVWVRLSASERWFLAMHILSIAAGLVLMQLDLDGIIDGLLVLLFFVYGAAITPFALRMGKKVLSQESLHDGEE